jgi:hypothetical protein
VPSAMTRATAVAISKRWRGLTACHPFRTAVPKKKIT